MFATLEPSYAATMYAYVTNVFVSNPYITVCLHKLVCYSHALARILLVYTGMYFQVVTITVRLLQPGHLKEN